MRVVFLVGPTARRLYSLCHSLSLCASIHLSFDSVISSAKQQSGSVLFMASTATTTTLRAVQPPSTSKPPRNPSANPPPDPPNANPNPIPDSNPISTAAESNPLAPSPDEVALSRATHLTRPEVLRLRSRRLKQLARCYRDHYWALMEELKVQYREYYWEYGVSPYRELPSASEKEARESNPQELEYSGDDPHNNPTPKNNFAAAGASGKGDADAKSNNPRCAFVGCKLKAMALTSFCHLHILSDSKQKLYKPCSYVIKRYSFFPLQFPLVLSCPQSLGFF